MQNLPSTTHLALIATACAAAALTGCKPTVTVNPIEIKPIYMTLDINLKVDRELDNFFDFEHQGSATAPASQPAAPASPAAPAPAASPAPGTSPSGEGGS